MKSITSNEYRPGDNLREGGVKQDANKVRYDLIPPEGVHGVAEILTYGANKYTDRNWELGMDWSRPYGAVLRHLFAWWDGEDRDPETGKSHLWHAATNIFFLITYEKRKRGNDDRPASQNSQLSFSFSPDTMLGK